VPVALIYSRAPRRSGEEDEPVLLLLPFLSSNSHDLLWLMYSLSVVELSVC
jgi:hypothetical protein